MGTKQRTTAGHEMFYHIMSFYIFVEGVCFAPRGAGPLSPCKKQH